MPLVVDDLIFVADGLRQILEDEVFDAAVAGLRDPPLPGQLELLERRRRDDVAGTLRVLAVVRRQREESVVDLPPTPRRVRTLVPTPAVEAVPVEEQLPAVTLFLGCELIVRCRRGGLSRD